MSFEFYEHIRTWNPKVKRYNSQLHNVYNSIPDTKGCMENITCEGGCGAWCCQIQTPQLLYCEFLLAWKYISKNWTDDDICKLLRRCMLNAVGILPTKQCVFFQSETKLCSIHKVRPYNCRIYGITPAEEFNPRYERLKKEYEQIPGAVIRPQCDLVSTEDGSVVTTKDTDKWWDKVVEVERKIGIRKNLITDEMGGSYRTPHDHILLYLMPENVLNGLAGIRNYDEWQKKVEAVDNLISVMKEHFRNAE